MAPTATPTPKPELKYLYALSDTKLEVRFEANIFEIQNPLFRRPLIKDGKTGTPTSWFERYMVMTQEYMIDFDVICDNAKLTNTEWRLPGTSFTYFDREVRELLVGLSKKTSYLLRHDRNTDLDRDGGVNFAVILEKTGMFGNPLMVIEALSPKHWGPATQEPSKARFEFEVMTWEFEKPGGGGTRPYERVMRVRALQGHSMHKGEAGLVAGPL